MPRRESHKVGTKVQFFADAKYNLITQNPESITHTKNGLAVTGDVAVGQPFMLIGRVLSAGDEEEATTYTITFYDKDNPYKFRIIGVRFQVISIVAGDFTDADGGNLDITLQDGDGAESETFTDVLADFALDDDYVNGEGEYFPSSTVPLNRVNQFINVGDSLRALVIVDPDDTVVAGAGASAVGVDIIVECVRVE